VRVLDTSVAVDHLRGLGSATAVLLGLVEGGEDIAASELVRFELLAGVRSRELARLEEFFGTLWWVPVTAEVARVAAHLARRYGRSHSGIDAVDYLIAATTTLLDAELLTTNVRHFPMFPRLTAPY
jgi:predicted nucleic acid-binding protein